MAPSRVLIQTMEGFGDTLYQRPLIREMAGRMRLTLQTPWPELYEGIPRLLFLQHPTKLRTQAKNLSRQLPGRWAVRQQFLPKPVRLWYGPDLPKSNILDIMARKLGATFRPEFFDLPDCGPSPIVSARPIALLRPVTIRREWMNVARAPRPEYVAQAASILRERFHVVSVADLAEGEEWLEGEEPEADQRFHRGELPPRQLLALVKQAAVVVGGVGWIAPAAVAGRRPLILIGGGQGGHNAPERIFHPLLDTSRVRWLLPSHYCRCVDMKHDCDKEITAFPARFRATLDELVPVASEAAA